MNIQSKRKSEKRKRKFLLKDTLIKIKPRKKVKRGCLEGKIAEPEIQPEVQAISQTQAEKDAPCENEIKPPKKAGKKSYGKHGKPPIEMLPTHEEDISPINDYKAQVQINLAVQTKNIFQINKLISEYGQRKKLDVAMKTYAESIKGGLWPTVYTLTSIINACVRCGELDRAQNYLNEMKSAGVAPNEVTLTALIKGFCQEGLVERAVEELSNMKLQGLKPNIRTFNTILRGCLRCGRLPESRAIFQEVLDSQQADITSYEYFIKTLSQKLQVKEAWEIAREIKEKFGWEQSSIYSAIATSAALVGKFKLSAKALKLARRTLGIDIVGGHEMKNKASAELFSKIKSEEVEKECSRVENFLNTLEEQGHQKPEEQGLNNVILINKHEHPAKKINFKKIFNNDLPIFLEICSGHGDWVIEKAGKDRGKVNWVALEIRYERVFIIWSKMKFKRLDNLVILGGEANEILTNFVKSNVLSEVFVNYPDPPVWDRSQWLLIKSSFLQQVHRVLKAEKSITIATDDKSYSYTMCDEFLKVKDLFRSAFPGRPMLNQIPEGYGSSYFDRFWMNGNKSERFFLKYIKLV